MFLRFYDPTSGTIYLNNTDVKYINPRLYRRQMALVQQEPTLYQGSIRENIAIDLEMDGPVTDEMIITACRQANAYEFVSSLPDGLSTYCGSNGIALSGGQQQRIAIARALI